LPFQLSYSSAKQNQDQICLEFRNIGTMKPRKVKLEMIWFFEQSDRVKENLEVLTIPITPSPVVNRFLSSFHFHPERWPMTQILFWPRPFANQVRANNWGQHEESNLRHREVRIGRYG
jgi:hypothetical protein